MGRKSEKPDYFTKEWYLNTKAQRKTDKEIADQLQVDLKTLRRWRLETGIKPMQSKKNKIHKPDIFTKEWYEEQKELGKTDGMIANDFNVSGKVLTGWKKEIKVGRFRKITLWDEYEEVALKNEVSYHMFMRRIREGMEPEEAIEKGKLNTIQYESERDETMEYDRANRIKYNPEFHDNHGKHFTEEDLIYLCSQFGAKSGRDLAFALGRTEAGIHGTLKRVRESGKFEYYKSLDY